MNNYTLSDYDEILMGEKAALVCTLGTEPQVLTLSLSLLLTQGVPIKEAVGFYSRSTDPMLQSAVKTIQDAWPELPFGRDISLRLSEVPIEDLDSDKALSAAYKHIRHQVFIYKSQGWSIHFNVSGGRKPLALCAFIVAQFLFGENDHMWYLVSDPKLVRSRKLIAGPNDRCRLIELPVPLWTESDSLIAALARYDDPWAVSLAQRRFLHQEERRRWKEFMLTVLTPAECRVVRELVINGGTNSDIAQRLHKSPRTVGHQLAAAFRKLRVFLNWPEDLVINRATMAALLSPYIREDGLYRLGRMADVEGNYSRYDRKRRR